MLASLLHNPTKLVTFFTGWRIKFMSPKSNLTKILPVGNLAYLCNLLQLLSSCFYACKSVNKVCTRELLELFSLAFHTTHQKNQDNHRLSITSSVTANS